MSSLFGNPKPTDSLFGTPAAASAQPQASTTSSVFGSTTTQPQSSSTSSTSIFANIGSSKPTENPSLFSSLGGNAGATDQKPSLFGNPQTQQQSSSATGGGLFSSLGATKPAAPNLFGATNTTATTQPAGSSLFAPQQTQQQNDQTSTQDQQQQHQDGQQTQTQSKPRQPGYFENLLEKGRKRQHEYNSGPGFQELPNLHLGLGDISKKVRALGGQGPQYQGGRASDSKAHYVLAASGINPGTTRRDLDSLASQPPISRSVQGPPDWDPDTYKYVEQLQEQSTKRMIAEGLERAQRNFDAYLEENIDINWELQRKRIYEHFGLMPKGGKGSDDQAGTPGGKGAFGRSSRKGKSTSKPSAQSSLNRSVFGQSSLQKSVIGTPGVGSGNSALFADVAEKTAAAPETQDDRLLRVRQRKFADKVQNLNRARLDESSYPILSEFKNVECQSGGESPKQLADAYDALIDIVDDGKPKERQYADGYLDENALSPKSVKMRKRIINGSRGCLEKAFLEQLESLVLRNPKEANLGGVPTNINKVRAYIRIRASRRDLVPDGTELKVINDDYCWALVFFLLRSGLVRAATEYVTTNRMAFSTVDRNFATYITGYASSLDRRLERKVQDHINREYQQKTRVAPENQNDPYQIACYKIIGRCELSKRSIDTISQGVEDWIWLQFCLAREVNRVEESAGDVFGLQEVRETISEIGQRHFSKGAEGMGGYGTFFFLQILGGMFEQAVSYLYSYSYAAAVHFAIALDYYGLLRVSDFSVNQTELRES